MSFEAFTNFLPCFLYYCSVLIIAIIARQFVNNFLSRSNRFRVYFFEIFSTFLAVGCSLENPVVTHVYGQIAYGCALSSQCVMLALTFRGASTNPASIFVRLFRRQLPVLLALKLMACEVLGGALAAAYAPLAWDLLPSSGHEWRTDDLDSDYELAPGEIPDLSVAPSTGVLLEAGAMLASLTFAYVIHAAIEDRRYRYPFRLTRRLPQSRVLALVAEGAADACLVLAGKHLTGMYYNPVNAVAHQWRAPALLASSSFWLVYALGPALGALAFVFAVEPVL